jgi:hypothetical protein
VKHVLVAILLSGPALLWAAPAAGVNSTTGVWKIDGDVQGRPINMTCQLTEAERRLTGTCAGAIDGFVAHRVDGTVKDEKLQLHVQTAFGGNSIMLIVSGKLNADRSRLSGDLDVEPLGVGGKFEGERTTDLDAGLTTQDASGAQASPAAAQSTQLPAARPSTSVADASGTWKIEGDVQGTPVLLQCVLVQKQQALSGTCTSEGGKANVVTGEVTEQRLKWGFDADYQGQPLRVSMAATLASDSATMQGDMAVAPYNAEGGFKGTRQPAAAPTEGTPPTQ